MLRHLPTYAVNADLPTFVRLRWGGRISLRFRLRSPLIPAVVLTPGLSSAPSPWRWKGPCRGTVGREQVLTCSRGDAIRALAGHPLVVHDEHGSMPISAIRPEPGPSRGGLSPRLSGISENFIPASASS